MNKKLIAMLLSLIMLISLLPVTALAQAEETVPEEQLEENLPNQQAEAVQPEPQPDTETADAPAEIDADEEDAPDISEPIGDSGDEETVYVGDSSQSGAGVLVYDSIYQAVFYTTANKKRTVIVTKDCVETGVIDVSQCLITIKDDGQPHSVTMADENSYFLVSNTFGAAQLIFQDCEKLSFYPAAKGGKVAETSGSNTHLYIYSGSFYGDIVRTSGNVRIWGGAFLFDDATQRATYESYLSGGSIYGTGKAGWQGGIVHQCGAPTIQAQIPGQEGRSYLSFADAMEAEITQSITLLADAEITGLTGVVSGTEVTVNLNGHNIASQYTGVFEVDGVLNLTDSSAQASGTITSDFTYNVVPAVKVNDGGVFVMSGGTISTIEGPVTPSLAISAESGGHIVITGGTVLGAISAADSGAVTITGGSFNSDPTGFVNTDLYQVTEASGMYTVSAKTGAVAVAQVLPDGLPASCAKEYADLQQAVSSVSSGNATIKLLDNVQTDQTLDLSNYACITLNLNGFSYTFTGDDEPVFNIAGRLNITGTGRVTTAKSASAELKQGSGMLITYGGWYDLPPVGFTDDGYTIVKVEESEMAANPYTLTTTTGTITYSANTAVTGVTGVPAQQTKRAYLAGYTVLNIISADTPSGPELRFKGWNTSADGKGTAYQPGDSIVLTGDITLYAQWDEPVARIGETGYFTLADAIAAAGSGRTDIVLAADINEPQLIIPADKYILLDMNDNDVSSQITNNGTLIVCDNGPYEIEGRFSLEPNGSGSFYVLSGLYVFNPAAYLRASCIVDRAWLSEGDAHCVVPIELWIDDNPIDSAEDLPEGVTLDYITGTLTLNSFHGESIWSSGPLNIALVGSNTLTTTDPDSHAQLSILGSLSISGSDPTTDTLTINAGGGSGIEAVYYSSDVELSIENCSVTVTGTGTGNDRYSILTSSREDYSTTYVQQNSNVALSGNMYVGYYYSEDYYNDDSGPKSGNTYVDISGGSLTLSGRLITGETNNASQVTMRDKSEVTITASDGACISANSVIISSGSYSFTAPASSPIFSNTGSISGGSFNCDVSEYAAEGYICREVTECGVTRYKVVSDMYITDRGLTLADSIRMQFYVTVPENDSISNYYMVFTRAAATGAVIEQVNGSDAAESSYGYCFSTGIPAKNIGDEITIQLFRTGSEEPVDTQTDSVAQYCTDLLRSNVDARYKNLARALINYGYAAQTYFGYDGALTEDDAGEYSDLVIPPNANSFAKNDGVTSLVFNAASLLLKDTTLIRIYFTLADASDDSIENHSFTCGGKQLTPVKSGHGYYVDIEGIGPRSLNTAKTLRVDGTDFITYSPLTYAVRMNERSASSAELKSLCMALINYYNCAAVFNG